MPRNEAFESAMRSVADSVAIIRAVAGQENLELVYANSAFLWLAGLTDDEFLNRPDRERSLHGKSPLFDCLRRAIANPDHAYGELAYVDAAGHRRDLRWQTAPLPDAEPTAKQAIAVFSDVTRLLQAERSVRRAESLASIGTFTAAIGHELNNPLAAALLAAETGLSNYADPEKHKALDENLELIVDSLGRCQETVRALLRLAHDDREEPRPCDVNELVRRAVEWSRSNADQLEMSLELDLAANLPAVTGVPIELEIALSNLLNNALAANAPKARVEVQTRGEGRRVQIIVTDEGRGMTLAEQQQAFKPSHSMDRPEGRTGLGLYLVAQIVHRHRGLVSLRSNLNRGTVVTIDLPIP